MSRHLQSEDTDRPTSNFSRSSSEKEERLGRKVYYAPKAWTNPCDQEHHFFAPKDLDGAPDQNTSDVFDARRKRIQFNQDMARMINTNTLAFYFKAIKKEDFERETIFYRIDALPVLIKPSKEHFLKMKIDEAFKEAHRHMMYYKVALNLIACDNMLYPSKLSEHIMTLEVYHLRIMCDMELTYQFITKQPMPDDGKKEAYQFKMFVCESGVARILRQYLIIRDYIKFMEYLFYIYTYYSQ